MWPNDHGLTLILVLEVNVNPNRQAISVSAVHMKNLYHIENMALSHNHFHETFSYFISTLKAAIFIIVSKQIT